MNIRTLEHVEISLFVFFRSFKIKFYFIESKLEQFVYLSIEFVVIKRVCVDAMKYMTNAIFYLN